MFFRRHIFLPFGVSRYLNPTLCRRFFSFNYEEMTLIETFKNISDLHKFIILPKTICNATRRTQLYKEERDCAFGLVAIKYFDHEHLLGRISFLK